MDGNKTRRTPEPTAQDDGRPAKRAKGEDGEAVGAQPTNGDVDLDELDEADAVMDSANAAEASDLYLDTVSARFGVFRPF
jgi:hypothetical protein